MKKSILLLIVSVITLQLGAQTRTVRIHGTVKDAVSLIELSFPTDATLTKWVDVQVPLANGMFDTAIRLPFPSQIWIKKGMTRYPHIFISNDAEILIEADEKPQVKGSLMQDEYEREFLPFFHANDAMLDSLQSLMIRNYEAYRENVPAAIKDSVRLLAERYYAERAELLLQYIKLHPDSYVALWDINHLVARTPTYRYYDFQKLFSSFSDQMQQQSFINVLREKVKASATWQAGQPFPKEFFKGKEMMQTRLRDANRYYLIDFWFSHCAPCIREFPKLKEIYNQYHSKGFDIVSISVDKSRDEQDYQAAIRKYGLVWNHIWDKEGIQANHFTISTFPTYVLLDKEGGIVRFGIGADELEAFLKKNL
jgi:thiol-disulfide isomerase/thioredoxin